MTRSVGADCEPSREEEVEMGLEGLAIVEWESSREEEAEAGLESLANVEWEPSIEQEADPTWNSFAAPLPGEPDVTGEINNCDSGYASNADTPPKPLKEGPPSSDHTCALKYSQLPFRTKHYLLMYIQRILEATCLRYARENLSGYLTDPEWKRRNLLFPSHEYLDDRLVGRDWLAEDEIELEFWMRMFAERVPMPKSQIIFESVINLRNETVHRGDRGPMDFEELSHAMALPRLLADSKGESEMTNALRYVMQDPTLDENTAASVEEALYTPQPCTTHYQVLGRIQTMLEETCFNNAARKIPDVLTRKAWTMPEQVELQNWHAVFHSADLHHDDSAENLFPHMYPSDLLDLLWDTRIHIRIVVAHRLPLPHENLTAQVHRAIKICVLQGDWDQAVEIELLAEMYFTGLSRPQVLDRLERVYRVGPVVNQYERQRRVAIAGVLAREQGSVVNEGDALVVAHSFDARVPVFSDVPAEWTWSPSMCEELKRREPPFVESVWGGEELGG